MKNNFKIKYIITTFIVLASVFYIGTKYSQYNYTKENRQYYLNNMYFKLNDLINNISEVEKSKSPLVDSDKDTFNRLLLNLDRIKNLNQESSTFIRDNNSGTLLIVSQSFEFLHASLGYGLTMNGSLICDSFLQDGELSDKELKFLKVLSDDLQALKNSLYSEKTNQEDPTISLKEYEQITKAFVEKYNFHDVENIELGN